MHDNLDEQKEHLKIEDNKRKKEKRDNLNVDEKEHLRNTRKKERKLCVIISIMRKKNI